MRLLATVAVTLALGCTEKPEKPVTPAGLVVTRMPLGSSGETGEKPIFAARVMFGGTCPHEVTVVWNADGGRVTAASLRLERRNRTANVTGDVEIMKTDDESYGQVLTHCVDFDDASSTLMTGSLKLWPNGELLQGESWCQKGKTCEPNAVTMLKQ